jgi:hypothetical protein
MRKRKWQDLVVGQDGNIVRVDFRSDSDEPAPRFPGAGAQRVPRVPSDPWLPAPEDASWAVIPPRI